MTMFRSRPFVCLFAVWSSVVALAGVASCTSNGSVTIDDEAGTSTRDASTTADGAVKKDASTTADGAVAFDPTKVCAQELAYFTTCNVDPKDVTCTAAKFEPWCKDSQEKVDSEQRTIARAKCLVAANCDPALKNACIYSTYNTLALSTAQQKLVADYCQTCEPGVATCAAAHTVYDPAAGPKSVDDLYIAAWELATPLVNAIDQKCTGAAIADAGADAGTCARRFATCAADIYIDALPNCP